MSNQENISTPLSPNGRNAFKLNLVSGNLSHLLGEVLTVIDAATEGDKNKAIKDLIKDKFSKKHEWFGELAWKEIESENKGHAPQQEWERDLVYFADNDKVYSYKG